MTLSLASPRPGGNPFEVEHPERLSPEEIVDLFVAEYSGVEVIKKRKHTFIWGTRGSGKSMLLRYLEPRCKAIVHKREGQTWEEGIHNFLTSDQPFLGVRIACKEGYFNKSELLLMEKPVALILTEHMMNLSLAASVFRTLDEQFPKGFLQLDAQSMLVRKATGLFSPASIAGSVESANKLVDGSKEPLRWASELFNAELRKISAYLRDQAFPHRQVIYEGATSGYHDFLLPLAGYVQHLPGLDKVPVYFLIDDADRLRTDQQQIINTWMANRDQQYLCIKAAAQIHEYKTFHTRDGWLLETPHDYTEHSIEELYSGHRDDYTKKVRAIAKKRLGLARIDKEPEDYLPPDPEQDALLGEMKKAAEAEWEKVGCPGRREDFVHRYAVARLFQELRRTKKRRNYAGFANLVHLSSGVVRSFLEPCYLMYDNMASRGREAEARSYIPPNVQQHVVFNYSEDFILDDLEKIRKDLTPDKFTLLDCLETLLRSLSGLFYERLTDPASREARVFSFTVRDKLSEKARDVLQLGERYRYFQVRTYSTKEGGGREKWYILNRRLCPVYKLDPTGFEGRISLTSSLLDMALEDPQKFIRLRLKAQDTAQPELFSLAQGDDGA